MNTLLFLILFPLIVGILLLLIRNEHVRNVIVHLGAAVIASAAIFCAFSYFQEGYSHAFHSEAVGLLLLIAEEALSIGVAVIAFRYRQYLVAVLDLLQAAVILWYEGFGPGAEHSATQHLFIDKLSMILMLIVAVIGGLICVFAVPYMKDYHHHHQDVKDRRPFFFSLLFIFLSAMFGIVFSNDLTLIYIFWEVTTVCSFLLIGYTRTKEAIKNSFLALLMNVIGGLGFAGAIVYLGVAGGISSLDELLQSRGVINLTLPLIFLSVAALSKAAQFPFSKWLLGAMVAPTPTSALLHSSTMVKAGVYLLIRLSPLLAGTLPGMMVIGIGGFTFLVASLIAISQSDGKKVLAYSTIANLGLIVACAGIATYEAVWAAVMLIIFHAVSKSLLFLSVGKTEHVLGSRDIEDMHGLGVKLPEMALLMGIGIAGMFLAPFGMLISKWAALKAFLDSKNVLIVLMIVFGSAATLFYWTKWMGKLVAVMHKSERINARMKADEGAALWTLAALTTFLCLLFPLVSTYVIQPYLTAVFGVTDVTIIGRGSQIIMTMMMAMILLLPLGIHFLTSREEKLTTVYMAGINKGDNRNFVGYDGHNKRMYLSSWYMQNYFGESKLLNPAILVGAAAIVIVLAVAIGGLLP